MVASAPVRQREPRTTSLLRTWPHAATIVNEDGTHLSTIIVLGPPYDGRIVFGEVSEPAALLNHRFGRGGGQVMLIDNDDNIYGCLQTRWEGNHRTWWLEVDEWPTDAITAERR